MSNNDLIELISTQEDGELWTRSILGKKFAHLLQRALKAQIIILDGEYYKLSK
jgi:hypothetical protein